MKTQKQTINEMIAQIIAEARKLGYSEATIWRNITPKFQTVAVYYEKRGVCFYDPAITRELVDLQKERLDREEISIHYYKRVKSAANRLDEFYLTGTLHLNKGGKSVTAGIWSSALKSIYSSNGSLYIVRNKPYGFLTISCDLRIMKIKKDILYIMKGARIMIVTATEFKTNLGKYLEMAMKQDIFITKNGKSIARLTSPTVNKLAVLDSLVGIVSEDSAMDEETIRKERLDRQ